MRWIAFVGMLALLACGADGTQPRTQGKVGPTYPGSEVLREVERTDAETYDPPQGDNSCETRLTTYGSNDAPEAVTRFYEDNNFVVRGEGGRFEEGYRWVGEREGDPATWRKVDIASGDIGGKPEWETVFEVLAPACEPG